MKRRSFLLTSGSAILGSAGLGSMSRSAVGLEFELVSIPDVDPRNIDSLSVDFESFKINPHYIDSSEDLAVTITVGLGDIKSEEVQVDVPVKDEITKSDISSQLPILMDGIDTTRESVDGSVEIIIDHSDIGSKSYKQSFSITDNPLINGLVAYYPMERGQGEIIRDGSGFNIGQINGAKWSGSSKVGSNSLSFDGDNDFVTTTKSDSVLAVTTEFTFSFWVKRGELCSSVSSGQGDHTIIGKNGNSDPWIGYELAFSEGGEDGVSKDEIMFWTSGNNGDGWDGFGNTITDLDWHHIVVMFSGTKDGSGTAELYIDGEYKNDITNKPTPGSDSKRPFEIGRIRDQRYFNGLLDDLRIYNRVLSQEEIDDLYSLTNLSGQKVVESDIPSSNNGGVSRYMFNGGVSDSWSSNDGTGHTSVSPSFVNGVYGQAKNFDESNKDYIDVSHSSDLSNQEYSVSYWVQHRNVDNTYESHVYKGSDIDNPEWSFFRRRSGLDSDPVLVHKATIDGTVYNASITEIFEENNWDHVVGTFDGSKVETYKNGVKRVSIDASGSVDETTESLEIGGELNRDKYYFTGSIDDLRIYNKALTSSQVRDLFNKGSYRIS